MLLNVSALNSAALNTGTVPAPGPWDVFVITDTAGVIVSVSIVDGFYFDGTMGTPTVRPPALSDGFVLSDTLAAPTVRPPTLSDIFVFSDTLSPPTGKVAHLADVFVITDAAAAFRIVTLSDVFVWTDALPDPAVRPPTLSDSFVITDALPAPAVRPPTLSASFVITDALAVSGIVMPPLSDVFVWTDALSFSGAPTPTGLVYTVHTDTGAVGRYELPYPVTGLTCRAGVLYIATGDGLYALDAAQDPEGPVYWKIATGLSTLGSEYLKRVQDVDVLASTDGDTILNVVTTRLGVKRRDTFILSPLTREAPRDGIIKVGKGLSSVYWGIELEGYGSARIDGLRVSPIPLSRRR